MDNIFVVSPTVALVVSVILQMVKNSAWFPWLSRRTGKLNAIVSMVIALTTSLGIVATFDFDQSTGQFAAGFHGSLSDIGHAIGHAIVQWAEQHAFYKGFIAPAEILGEMRAALIAERVPPKP